MAAKLDIKRELNAVDRKVYDFYDNLTDEEKKAFSPYILMRYTSNVQGDADIQEWFLEKKYGISKEISSKYLDKGISCEEQSIALITG